MEAKKNVDDGLPDTILPVQLLERTEPDGPVRRMQNLMLAILEDGIRCLTVGDGGGSVHARLEARRAESWIRSRDRSWPFSFDNVCIALSFDPAWLRERILNSSAMQRAELRSHPRHRVNHLDARIAPRRERRRRREARRQTEATPPALETGAPPADRR